LRPGDFSLDIKLESGLFKVFAFSSYLWVLSFFPECFERDH